MRSEIQSRIQAQADTLRTVLSDVTDGAGARFGDRIGWEPSAPTILTPPSVLLAPPSWNYDSYSQSGPSELEWRVWLIAPADDVMVGRLWAMAHEAAVALDASDLVDGNVLDVEPSTWRPGVANLPAYVVRYSAILGDVA